MEKSMTITCPSCDHSFNAEDSFQKHIEAHLKEHQKALAARERALDQQVATRVQAQLAQKERELLARIQRDSAEQLAQYKQKLQSREEEVRSLKRAQLEVEDLKLRLAHQEEELALKYRRRHREEMEAERRKMREQAEEESSYKLKEQEKVIDRYKQQVTEMQRKMDQGSMELQGEVQELLIEDRLKELFPADTIEEVKKGVRGADVQHTVVHHGRSCGMLLFESKNASSFKEEWIDKLRSDQMSAGAHTAILVTKVMPRDVAEEYIVRQGVFICTPKIFPVVAALCRGKLIELKQQAERYSLQKDTMGLLYQYMTGDEFRMHLEEMVIGIHGIKEQIVKERAAFEKQWKMRDKEADRLYANLAQMFGSIKGIAGNSVKEIKSLELLV